MWFVYFSGSKENSEVSDDDSESTNERCVITKDNGCTSEDDGGTLGDNDQTSGDDNGTMDDDGHATMDGSDTTKNKVSDLSLVRFFKLFCAFCPRRNKFRLCIPSVCVSTFYHVSRWVNF